MTTSTHQIGRGVALFTLPENSFLGAASARLTPIGDDMQNPMPINLRASEDIRSDGWQAECRDTDGHLTRTHAPFKTDEDIVWLVREALEHGDTVTIWPVASAPLQNTAKGE